MRRLVTVGLCLVALSAGGTCADAAGVHPARVPAPAPTSFNTKAGRLLAELNRLRVEFKLLAFDLGARIKFTEQRLRALEREMRGPNANIPRLLELEEQAVETLAIATEEISAQQTALTAQAETIEAELRALGVTPPPWP
jgi:hypothetical protein